MKPEIWTYKGVNVYPASLNSSGIRWTALMGVGQCLRADTKEGMRRLITKVKRENNL
jgi:hypothetical protein